MLFDDTSVAISTGSGLTFRAVMPSFSRCVFQTRWSAKQRSGCLIRAIRKLVHEAKDLTQMLRGAAWPAKQTAPEQ